MSCSSSCSDHGSEGEGPVIEVVYPLNEETEVPNTGAQLFKTVLTEGKEHTHPPSGAKVTVHYVGTLASDGSEFDSSRGRGEPFVFTLGQGQVIKGWDKGVATMNKGEKAMLRCLPEYAYGAAGSPPKIPANSTLNFEVELLDWSCLSDVSEHAGTGQLMKSLVAPGKQGEYQTPEYESTVWFNVVARSRKEDDTAEIACGEEEYFKKEEWQVEMGADELPPGLEQALKSFKRGEHSLVAVHPSLLTTEAVQSTELTGEAAEFAKKLPTNGTGVVYDITVRDFNVVQTYQYKGQDKIDEGLKRKDQGNKYFVAKQWGKAIAKYRRALEFTDNTYDMPEELKGEASKVSVTVHNNLAQAYMNTKQYHDALSHCDAALKADPNNAKALFRRGKTLNLLQEWDDARRDLQRLLDHDQNNADAQAELAAINAAQAAFDKKERSKYAKMFQ